MSDQLPAQLRDWERRFVERGIDNLDPSDTEALALLLGRAAKQLEAQTWQPIATAPKDGTRVLLWNGYRRAFGWFSRYEDGSSGWHRQSLMGEPLRVHGITPETHWTLLPLPAPPDAAQDAQEPR